MGDKKVDELFRIILGNNRKEIGNYVSKNRSFLENFLRDYREKPELYMDYRIDDLLIRLEKLQDIEIYIAGVHKYSPIETIDEDVILRVMTKEEFLDYIIAFFGPNYEINKGWNMIYALEREFYRDYKEMTQYGFR